MHPNGVSGLPANLERPISRNLTRLRATITTPHVRIAVYYRSFGSAIHRQVKDTFTAPLHKQVQIIDAWHQNSKPREMHFCVDKIHSSVVHFNHVRKFFRALLSPERCHDVCNGGEVLHPLAPVSQLPVNTLVYAKLGWDETFAGGTVLGHK